MAQRYYRVSARVLAVVCVLLSMMSENFLYVSLISLSVAGCLFAMSRAEAFEYDREREYAVLSFNDKAEAFTNLGWVGLVFLTILLIGKFWFAPLP